jgi:hypothetical protein
MTMFPMNMPEMPPEMMGPVMDNPQGFADAMGSGMEAFSAAMEGGGGMEAAFEAFGDVAGPMMMDMGVPMEVFDAVGDMVGAAVGPAMMMGPADAGGGDMGAMMMDAVDMMMPEGMDMPPEVGGAMMDMGTAMGDAGVMPHDVAGEMMAPPGEPGYPMPCDAAGDPVMVPGDPGSVPMMDMGGEAILQAPPADGAMADMGTMMPPPGGYDHPPMGGDMMMPPPMNMDIAMMGPTDTLESMGMNPDGSGGAYESGTMDMGAMAAGDTGAELSGDMGAMDAAMGMGGDTSAELSGDMGDPAGMGAMDTAMGQAMDGAMDQGGAPIPVIGDEGFVEAEPVAAADPANDDPVDPSAGMG